MERLKQKLQEPESEIEKSLFHRFSYHALTFLPWLQEFRFCCCLLAQIRVLIGETSSLFLLLSVRFNSGSCRRTVSLISFSSHTSDLVL